MPKMETVNALLALGGDMRNTVPKTGLPVSEIPVLQAIHGDEAVHDIVPAESIEYAPQDEIDRLLQTYARAKDEDGNLMIRSVYPTRRSPLPNRLEELGLDEEFFKPTSRAKPMTASEQHDVYNSEDELPEEPEDEEDTTQASDATDKVSTDESEKGTKASTAKKPAKGKAASVMD